MWVSRECETGATCGPIVLKVVQWPVCAALYLVLEYHAPCGLKTPTPAASTSSQKSLGRSITRCSCAGRAAAQVFRVPLPFPFWDGRGPFAEALPGKAMPGREVQCGKGCVFSGFQRDARGCARRGPGGVHNTPLLFNAGPRSPNFHNPPAACFDSRSPNPYFSSFLNRPGFVHTHRGRQ
jgi:hypothetical protein